MLLGDIKAGNFWKFKAFPVSLVFFLCILFLLSGCNAGVDQGRFELELHSSLFGDISIPQGKSATAVVAINRKIDTPEYQPDINISLIDPPSWLEYSIDDNPASGDESRIRLEIGSEATPGIYRLILYGVGNKAGNIVDDSVTFHLVVERAKEINDAKNANYRISDKIFSLLKFGA